MALAGGGELAETRGPGAGAFVGLVLVHSGPDGAGEAARLLSWYDARARIAPREVPCSCRREDGHADPRCPHCGGSGHRTVMKNPDAKFASARPVGRWQDWSLSELADLAAGRCRVIVTPDGEWHERGHMSGEEWRAQARDLLADHAHFAAIAYEFTSPDDGENGGMA